MEEKTFSEDYWKGYVDCAMALLLAIDSHPEAAKRVGAAIDALTGKKSKDALPDAPTPTDNT